MKKTVLLRKKKSVTVYSTYEKTKEFENLQSAADFIKWAGIYRLRDSASSTEGQKQFYCCKVDPCCSSKVRFLLTGMSKNLEASYLYQI